MNTATDARPASQKMDELVITYDPRSTFYAVMLGDGKLRGDDAGSSYYPWLKDAVRAADPAGDRLWEYPCDVRDRELHPNAVLFSRRKKAHPVERSGLARAAFNS